MHTPPIDRTLICNAILYHFQITLYCGRINRPYIPLTLFLLSRPLEQLEFIRLSNLLAEICFVPPTRPQRFILPRNFQSRYRRHLVTLNPFSNSPLRDDLLIKALVSVFTPYKNFTSFEFNLGSTCFSTTSRHTPPENAPAFRNNLHNASLFSSSTASSLEVIIRSSFKGRGLFSVDFPPKTSEKRDVKT